MTVMKMEPKMSESGRVMMQIIPGTEEELPCEMLIIAAGFTGPEKQIKEAFEAEFSKDSYQTTVENVFACGDCRTGQSLVVKPWWTDRNVQKQWLNIWINNYNMNH